MPPSPADFIHARACKPFCEKSLTLPKTGYENARVAFINDLKDRYSITFLM